MAQHHGRPMGAYPSANGIQSVHVGSVSREEKRQKKGRKPCGDLNALIFTLGSAVLLESRMSRGGERNPWMRVLRARRLKCQHR